MSYLRPLAALRRSGCVCVEDWPSSTSTQTPPAPLALSSLTRHCASGAPGAGTGATAAQWPRRGAGRDAHTDRHAGIFRLITGRDARPAAVCDLASIAPLVLICGQKVFFFFWATQRAVSILFEASGRPSPQVESTCPSILAETSSLMCITVFNGNRRPTETIFL